MVMGKMWPDAEHSRGIHTHAQAHTQHSLAQHSHNGQTRAPRYSTHMNRTNTDGTKQSFAVSHITDRQLPFSSEIPPQPRPGGRRTERADSNEHPSYHAYNTNNPRHTGGCCHPSLLGGDMVRCYSRDPATGSTPGTVKGRQRWFKGGFAFDIGCGWRQVSEIRASMSGIPRVNSKTTHGQTHGHNSDRK